MKSIRTSIILIACLIASNHAAANQNLSERVEFFKNFESGNLGRVEFVKADTIINDEGESIVRLRYNLYAEPDPANPVDTSLEPSSRWFYFLMTGVKGKEIVATVKNSDCKAPVYSYDGEHFTRFEPNNPDTSCDASDSLPEGCLKCTGSYTFSKRFDRDSVYVAYFTPYTTKRLNGKLEEWQWRLGVKIYSIGESTEGREMRMLTITNPYLPDKNKKRIYIHGRIHPSETPASYCLEGLIDYLTGTSEYAISLRDNAVFYILPFANPDGVVRGYSRCNSNGVNLEINYDRPDSLTEREVKNIKKFLQTTTFGGKPIDMFLNFHSQSADYMTYWIHTAESTSERYNKELLTFANLDMAENRYFTKEDLSFSPIASKYLEGYFWDYFGSATIALTHETPYSYYSSNEWGDWVTEENLKEIGKTALKAIGDYLRIADAERIVLLPHSSKRCKRVNDTNHLYIGDYYYVGEESRASVTYKTKNLPKGDYILYKLVVGINNNDGKPICYREIEEFTQEREGSFSYKIAIEKGEMVNALLLVKR